MDLTRTLACCGALVLYGLILLLRQRSCGVRFRSRGETEPVHHGLTSSVAETATADRG